MRRYLFGGRLGDLLERLRRSYGLVPGVMLVLSVGLAVAMVRLDEWLALDQAHEHTWFTILQGSGARAILSTLATSMAGISGTVFSIIIVVLQLAASQFGPHVLGSFLKDRGNQLTLGTFVSAFLYALVVILSIREKSGFVPFSAVYMGVLIGAVAMAVLIYFINHVAQFIRVESITARLADEMREATGSVFPDALGAGEQVTREVPPCRPERFDDEARPIAVSKGGYVRRMDETRLIQLATRHDLLIWLDARPGDFLLPGAVAIEAAPADRVGDDVAEDLRRTVVLGIRRTPNQDIAYALQQLAEVGIRALSPAINAPYTAIPCIDLLGEGLCQIAARKMPSLYRHDEQGRQRVLVGRRATLADLTHSALGAIASAGRRNADVMARLVRTALLIAERAQDPADRAEIRALAEGFVAEAQGTLGSERERARVRAVSLESGGARIV